MALVACQECGKEISAEALSCPHCGQPNTAQLHRGQDRKQKIGCAFMVAALLLALVVPPAIAGVIFIVGLVLMLLNTRFS